MTLREIFRLSHRELVAYRTRSVATVVTVGALFGLLLMILFAVQGLENIVFRYARDATGGEVFLVSDYKDPDLVRERIQEYDGKIVIFSTEELEKLGGELPETTVVAKFTDLKKAYAYYTKEDKMEWGYDSEKYQIEEIYSNQMGVYRYFREKNQDLVWPVTVVLVIVSAFILAFTMAHLIASSTKTFVLYRSIGATRGQLLMIYFVYLMELCAASALFAVAVALILAGILTAAFWNYLSTQLHEFYPEASSFWPILIGVNWREMAVLVSMFMVAPVSFLLCLDQFSNKKIAQKLKGD